MANWQQDGFPFDYNSVMLSTFYDNNLKSLDALVQNYDPSEYSILKNSDNSRNVYGDKSEIIKTSTWKEYVLGWMGHKPNDTCSFDLNT